MELASTRYSLLLRIQNADDHAAWSEFVVIYEPLVYGLARRRGLQDADAQDLCQEVFRTVAKAAHRFTPSGDRGSFRAWLFTVTRNLLVNLSRKERREPRGTGESDMIRMLNAQPCPADEHSRVIQAEYDRHLFQFATDSIRREFQPKTWEAFWKTAVELQSPADTAAELGITVGAVYIARSRVLARLKTRVSEIEGGKTT